MTGVISTPPMGEMIFLLITKTGSVGIVTSNHIPFFSLTWGYQVRTILNKNAKVSPVKRKPRKTWILGMYLISSGVTKLKALRLSS
tara:strand:- start:325 stop:582 length:258 start_codon:yes stop_codon:yes gene_type:complete